VIDLVPAWFCADARWRSGAGRCPTPLAPMRPSTLAFVYVPTRLEYRPCCLVIRKTYASNDHSGELHRNTWPTAYRRVALDLAVGDRAHGLLL
jgi:hypothetical protein